MNRISALLAGLTLFVATALPASAGVLYSQRLDPSLSGSWLSQTANGTSGFNQAFENFTLTSGATVTNVAWSGFLNPSFGTIDGFTINFYADNFNNDGAPGSIGTLLASTTITGDAGQTANAVPNKGAFGVFNFDSAITPFVVDANTTYWISIVADPDQGSADYRWAFSDQGDGSFNSFDGTDVTSIGPGVNLAFALSNASTPEPSSLTMAGTGILALAGFARRRFAGR
jgi:PEP-CTERM motif